VVLAVVFAQCAHAQNLFVDFNSNQDSGPHPMAGYQSYDAEHEVIASFGPRTYAAFGTNVTVTPAWPNTTANTVQQAIDRGAGNDANWLGDSLDLLTDWIGSDSRTTQGGNGDWLRDGASEPTYMTLNLAGLPAGNYDWLSFHHDTEHMWSDFQVELSTDGGATFGAAIDHQMTDSTDGGSPASPMVFTGAADPDPRNLPSTFTTSFAANGVDDVVFRFAPFADGVDPTGVHKQFFGMNGFELVPEPTASVLFGIGALFMLVRRRRQQ
jgi:hypothetical protein